MKTTGDSRIAWRLKRGRSHRCPFEYGNPEPEPDWSLYEGAEGWERPDWSPTIDCYNHTRWRVILVDGAAVDCCSPDAHGIGMVFWSAPLVGPRWEPAFEQAMKYYYREEDLAALVAREHPLVELLRSRSRRPLGAVTYEVKHRP